MTDWQSALLYHSHWVHSLLDSLEHLRSSELVIVTAMMWSFIQNDEIPFSSVKVDECRIPASLYSRLAKTDNCIS